MGSSKAVAIWLILLCSCVWAKPPFVFVQVASSTDHWSDWGDQLKKKLSDCGFEVETISPNSEKDLQAKLAASKAPNAVPIIFQSHGNEDYTFDHAFKINGEQTKNALLKRFDRSSIYFETCYSGFCLKDASCPIGAACSAVQESFIQNQVSPLLTDLYCDSIDACAKFPNIDTNRDGAIDGDELNRHLIKEHGKPAPVEFHSESIPPTDKGTFPTEAFKNAIEKCRKAGATDDRISWEQNCVVYFNRELSGKGLETLSKEYFRGTPAISGRLPAMPDECALPSTEEAIKQVTRSELPVQKIDVAKKTAIFGDAERREAFALSRAKLQNIVLSCATPTDAATVRNKHRLPSNPNEDLKPQNPFFNSSFRIACAKPTKRARPSVSGLQFREREMREEPSH